MECVAILALIVCASLVHSLWALVRLCFVRADGNRILPVSLEPCARCGRSLADDARTCVACGLDAFSPRATQLRRLEAGVALLQEFHEQNQLDDDTCERVYRCIEERQLAILNDVAAPTARPSAAPLSTAALDRLLRTSIDLRAMPFAHRRQALAWFEKSFATGWQTLCLPALDKLAALLQIAGQPRDALTVYRHLVESAPTGPARGQAALEAGQLAFEHGRMDDAAWFAEAAAAEPLGHAQRQNLARLRRTLRPLAAQVVLLEIDAPATPPPELPRPAPPAPPTPPPTPRRSFGEMLGSFMEERNILWGELVGGLLIVGCSIALVISLWRTLQQIPFFPFLVFALLTAGLFGAGFYTLSHWKLESTSRGLLVIAILLLPLNFVVLAGLPGPAGPGVVELGLGLGVLAGFGWLVRRASAVLFDPPLQATGVRTRAALPLAVLGCAGTVLAVPRLGAGSGPGLFFLTALPTLCSAGAAGWLLLRLSRAATFTTRQAGALFVFLGSAGFAAAVALGFLVYWLADAPRVLPVVAVAAAVLGVPGLFGGLLALGAFDRESPERSNATDELPHDLLYRIAGGTVLAGMAIQGLAVCLAWPNVVALWLTCLMNFAALMVAALHYRRPQGYPLALLCLTIGYLTLVQSAVGGIPAGGNAGALQLLTALVSPASGVALVPLVLGLAVTAEILARRQRREDGGILAAGAAALGLAALLLVVAEARFRPLRALGVQTFIAVACLGFNARWRRPSATIAAAILLYSIVLLTFAQLWPATTASWLLSFAFLGQSSAGLALALLVLFVARKRLDTAWVRGVYLDPLWGTVLTTSAFAVPLLARLGAWAELAPLAAGVAWIGTLWLIAGVVRRERVLVRAAQVGMSVAVLLGVTAHLRGQGWIADEWAALLTPHSLHAHGVALALFAMLCAFARGMFRSRWLPPATGTFDGGVRNALIVGQFVLAVIGVAPAVCGELSIAGAAGAIVPAFFAPGAWWLLAALAALVAARRWQGRWPAAQVLGVLALLPIPLLAAGMIGHASVVVALCWGLAIFFMAGSILLWFRHRMAFVAVCVGGRSEDDDKSVMCRRCLVPMAAVPAIVLALAASERCLHEPLAPFFASPGVVISLILPLALVAIGFVGHAFRERLPGYLFAAGLLAVFCVGGGYALAVKASGGTLDVAVIVRTLQFGTGMGAIWTLCWLAGRSSFNAWRACVDSPAGQALLWVQTVLVGIGNAMLLVPALTLLMGRHADGNAGYPAAMPLTLEVGSVLGAAVLLLSTIAHRWFTRLGRLHGVLPVLGFVAPGVLVLLACSAEHLGAGWGYRAFMIGAALVAFIGAMRARDEAQRNVHLFWARLSGIVIVAAAFKAAFAHADGGAAGVALLFFAAAAVAWALVLRQEAWMFGAGGAVNLALFFLVRAACTEMSFAAWWVWLVQAEVVASGVMAMLWLWLRTRFEPRSPHAFWLDGYVQSAALLGNAVVLMPVLFEVLVRPQGPMSAFVHQVGSIAGWVAFLLSAAAAMWHARPFLRVHVQAILGILLGCLATASAAHFDHGGWLAHHVLTVAWSLAGLAILAHAARRDEPADGSSSRSAAGWVMALSLLVVGLALRGAWGDPGRPYWSCAAVLTAAVLVGALAVWRRRVAFVYVSGLLPLAAGYVVWQAWLVDIVGVQTWIAWGPGVLDRFLFIETICLAASSAVWSLVLSRLRRDLDFAWHERWPPFPAAAALLALQVLVVLIGGGLISDLFGERIHVAGGLAWLALAATSLAFLLEYHAPSRRDPRVALPALHLLGLLAVALALHGAALPPRRLLWFAAPALAGYAFATAMLLRAMRRNHVCIRATQRFTLMTALLLAAWIAFHFETWGERMIGPLTTTVGMMTVLCSRGLWRRPRQPRVLALGLVVLAQIAWACFDPAGPGPWLNRNALSLVILIGAGLICRTQGLAEGPWRSWLWRFGPICDALAALQLPVLVVHEFLTYNPVARQAPLVGFSVVMVVALLLALMAKWIYTAREAALDPLGLSPLGRMAYVYAAEIALGLLLLHLKFCVPDFYHPIIGRQWTLITMGLAYAAVGVGEVLARRGAWTIATPIRRTAVFLPLVPIAAFLARPAALACTPLGERFPGLQPLLRMMERIPQSYLLHITLWLLLALLYGGLGWVRRVPRYGLLAGLAVTFALWVVWANHEELRFTQHPQLWLIPLGLVVLATEHVYRDRLGPGGRGAIRYVGLLLIYASSAADMFMTGVGNSVLLPVVLAVLAVAGVLVGILLRVRAHLTFGAAFLCVVIFAEIWHAAVDRRQTWVWWACGIVLGAAILALFALFEKRRQEVLQVVAEIHRWE